MWESQIQEGVEMSGSVQEKSRGFTLTELAVTIAAIAIMLFAVCPALTYARGRTRTVVCENTLQGFGAGMLVYVNENLDYIPGVNTSGVATRAKVGTEAMYTLRTVPVQSYDWMTPLLQGDPNLPERWVQRFNYLLGEYRCPQQTATALLYTPSLVQLPRDDLDWARSHTWLAPSYLMPAYFSYWGQSHANEVLAPHEENPFILIRASVPPASWPVVNTDFNSHIEQVGPAARKVFAADGTRYLTSAGYIDLDLSPDPIYFGAFTDVGAWEPLSTTYGVKAGTMNWDGNTVSTGSPSQGRNLPISYRHGIDLSGGPQAPPLPAEEPVGELAIGGASVITVPLNDGSAQGNHGFINAVFFDGHVARMNDRASRDIDRWYPTGSVRNGDYTGLTTAPAGYVIP